MAYQYDTLNRLIQEAGSGGPQAWTQSYAYDGFGNLSQKSTSPSGTNWAVASAPGTNQLINQSYDANGNLLVNSATYDIDNRISSETLDGVPLNFSYDAAGHRVTEDNGSSVNVFFYDISGRRIITYTCNSNFAPLSKSASCTSSPAVYFGGKLVQKDLALVATDRLRSVRANAYGEKFEYQPYGAAPA
ncbi:MAG: hypothetical protein JOZ22_11560 [Acidobacteriia bacterium]|nr:hypothetical protein [Terriglobia bacterium]